MDSVDEQHKIDLIMIELTERLEKEGLSEWKVIAFHEDTKLIDLFNEV